MLKTGNLFIDLFSQAIIFIPLFPVIIIFLRSVYQKDLLTYLLILCILNFIGNLLPRITKTTHLFTVSAQHLFSLLELVLLVQIFKSVLHQKLKGLIEVFLIAFVSSVTTYYLLKGVDQDGLEWGIVQDSLILLVGIAAVGQGLSNNSLYVLRQPLFWITVGTLFYFAVSFVVGLADSCCSTKDSSMIQDKTILLDIALVVRYAFYCMAALAYQHPPRDREDMGNY